MGSRPDSQRGAALIGVLWTLMVLALIAAAVVADLRSELRHNAAVTDAAIAEALADGGIARALVALAEPDPARRWKSGHSARYVFPEGEVAVSIADETGRIDLNTGLDALMLALLTGEGRLDAATAARLLARIKDYRDADDQRQDGGAEAADYAAAGLDWGPKNRPFEAVIELQRVLGMSPALHARLAPFLTIHNRQRGIDPTAAPPRLRELADRLSSGPGPHLARAQGQVFAIRAEARTTTGGVYIREAVAAVPRRPETPWVILEWHQGMAQPEGDD